MITADNLLPKRKLTAAERKLPLCRHQDCDKPSRVGAHHNSYYCSPSCAQSWAAKLAGNTQIVNRYQAAIYEELLAMLGDGKSAEEVVERLLASVEDAPERIVRDVPGRA